MLFDEVDIPFMLEIDPLILYATEVPNNLYTDNVFKRLVASPIE